MNVFEHVFWSISWSCCAIWGISAGARMLGEDVSIPVAAGIVIMVGALRSPSRSSERKDKSALDRRAEAIANLIVLGIAFATVACIAWATA